MPEQSVTHTTFSIERTYPTTPERVFAAFADPDKKRRWFINEKGAEIDAFEMDFRVGGKERRHFGLGQGAPQGASTCTNDTTYQDIVDNRRIVIAYTMSLGDKRISASLATFELLPTEKGTTLLFTEQSAFFEGADGPRIREDGWRLLLDQLAKELAR